MSADAPLPRAMNRIPDWRDNLPRTGAEVSYLGYRRLDVTGWKEAVFGREHGDDGEYTKVYPNVHEGPRMRIRIETLLDRRQAAIRETAHDAGLGLDIWGMLG